MPWRRLDVSLTEVGGIDHHADVVHQRHDLGEILADPLLVVDERRVAKDVRPQLDPFRCQRIVSQLQEARDRRLPRLRGVLPSEVGGRQVTIGGKAHIVVLDLIEPKLRCFQGQVDVRLPQLLVEGVHPADAVIVTPEVAGHLVYHRQIRSSIGNQGILEHHHPRDRIDVPVLELLQHVVHIIEGLNRLGVTKEGDLAVVIDGVLLDVDDKRVQFRVVDKLDQTLDFVGVCHGVAVGVDRLDLNPLQGGIRGAVGGDRHPHFGKPGASDKHFRDVGRVGEPVRAVALGHCHSIAGAHDRPLDGSTGSIRH